MKKTIRIFAPATIANLGCGFDVMGLALEKIGDVLEIAVEEGYGLQIINKSGAELPADPEKNVITPAILAFWKAYGKQMRVEVTIEKKIRPGSGIGSSAASSVGVVYGLNELLDRPFTVEQLIPFAMEGERLISGAVHADNVGPSLLGGIVFIRGYEPLDLISLPVPESFYCTLVHPHIVVGAKAGREVLREEIPLKEAVVQWGNIGGLVAGLMMGNVELVARSMRDVIAEPFRKHFVPLFDELRTGSLEAGAMAVNISGSGPAVFALSASLPAAEKVEKAMRAHFRHLEIEADVYVSGVSKKGAREVTEEEEK